MIPKSTVETAKENAGAHAGIFLLHLGSDSA